MYLVNAQEMRELDRQAIEEVGIPAAVLMELAGRAVAEEVKRHRRPGCRVTVLVGHGNNGGDGLVAARHLAGAGYETHIWLVGKKERMSHEAALYWNICQHLSIPSHIFTDDAGAAFRGELARTDVVIDSMLGTGLRGEVRHPIRQVIQWLNHTRVPLVVAADVPSGVHTDSGKVLGEAVHAHRTVTFAYPKWCHFLAPAAELTGELTVADIGIPRSLAEAYPIRARVTDVTSWSDVLRPRAAFSHKGTYGHVLVIGGQRGMAGAPALAARAALKAGAGLVTSAVPHGIQDVVAAHSVEGLTWGIGNEREDVWHEETAEALVMKMANFDAVAIGPGLGRFLKDVAWLQTLLRSAKAPVVLDADALNIVAENLDLLKECRTPVVLTPHPGEMARLLQREVHDIENRRPEVASQLAEATGAVVVLKGTHTLTAFPDGKRFVNLTGSPAMAKGGSGDVLTGVIAAKIAQGYPLEEAVPLAVSLHGYAGECAAEKDHEATVLATDIVENLGPALHVMSNSHPSVTDTFPGK